MTSSDPFFDLANIFLTISYFTLIFIGKEHEKGNIINIVNDSSIQGSAKFWSSVNGMNLHNALEYHRVLHLRRKPSHVRILYLFFYSFKIKLGQYLLLQEEYLYL